MQNIPVFSAYWLGHLVGLIHSADCDSCLDQVSFIKCIFVFTTRISQVHGVFWFPHTRMADHLVIPPGPGFDSRSLHRGQQSKEVRRCSLEPSTLKENLLNSGSMSLVLRISSLGTLRACYKCRISLQTSCLKACVLILEIHVRGTV